MIHCIFPAAVCCLLAGAGSLSAQDRDIIPIGMVDSLVKDLSVGKQKIIDADFPGMVKEFTGLNVKVLQGGDPPAAVQKLGDGQWRLGVLQGVEFAWAQAKDAKLTPLMIAVGGQKTIHALLIGKKDGAAKGFDDLKGKAVAILQSREHCRLFADKNSGGSAKKHFGKITYTGNSESALDDILRGKVQAVVADNTALENYKSIKPGGYNRLKVLAQSEQFPATTIAYREGGLSSAVLDKFKEGMLRANDTAKGRDLMANFDITAFVAPPTDYQEQLSAILKAYPAPTK